MSKQTNISDRYLLQVDQLVQGANTSRDKLELYHELIKGLEMQLLYVTHSLLDESEQQKGVDLMCERVRANLASLNDYISKRST